MKIRIIFFFIIVLSIALPLVSQETEQTVEELYLKGGITAQVIQAEAKSLDRNTKFSALQDIAKMIEDGSAVDNPAIASILNYLVGESVTMVIRKQGKVVNDFPMVRKEAARLLGALGTQKAADYLAKVIHTDPEPMVVSEAILAISTIAVDDVQSRNNSIISAVYRQTSRNKDNNLAYAYLLAVENIFKRENRVSSMTILEEISKIANPRQGYNKVVREKAIALLKSMQEL